MYICRKCNTAVEDSDRYCGGCGAYIGEPAAKKDNWEEENGLEEYKAREEHIEVALEDNKGEVSENININSERLASFVSQEDAILIRLLKSTGIKNIVLITAAVMFAMPMLLCLIAKFCFVVPNDLVDIILPFNLLSSDFKSMLNLPGSLVKGITFSFLGIAVVVTVLFASLYFLIRLVLKAEVDVKRLWKSVMLSCTIYGTSLALFLAASFINKTAANILMLAGIITSLFTMQTTVDSVVAGDKNKTILLTAVSIVISYAAAHSYLYFFLR